MSSKKKRPRGNPAAPSHLVEQAREQHRARVASLGAFDRDVVLREEVIQELRLFVATQDESNALTEIYAASGQAIAATARVELALGALVAFLLNPGDPGRVRNATLSLATMERLTMLKAQEPNWVSRKRVHRVIQELAEFRNKLAHRRWQAWRPDGNEGVEWGTFLEGFSTDHARWESLALSVDDVEAYTRRALVMDEALTAILMTAGDHYANTGRVELFEARKAIDRAFVLGEGVHPSWWEAMRDELLPRPTETSPDR